MNEKVKEYLWSSFVTFVAAFAIAVVPMLNTDLPMSQVAIFALMMTGARAGFRAVLNLLTTNFRSI